MNCLIGMGKLSSEKADEKKVFEKDMLFATLDTSTRKIAVPGRKPFLLSDTVGFIENIPHDLIKAFRSTLSELKYADVLLIVMDSSDPNHKAHRKVTEDTLNDLGTEGIPRIYVYNKSDLRDPDMTVKNVPGSESVYISAKSGYGIQELMDMLEDIFRTGDRRVEITVPYTSGDLLNRIHNEGNVLSQNYEEDGVHITADCPEALADFVSARLSPADEEM
jgi:GTP-binding protein HflX